MAVLAFVAGAVIGTWHFWWPNQRDLEAENKVLREKLYKASWVDEAIRRRIVIADAAVDYPAVLHTQKEYGVPHSYLVALRQCENGPNGLELGNIGLPTLAMQQRYPVEHWNYLAAGKTLSVYAWKWIDSSEVRRRDFFRYLATKYPAKQDQKKWYKAMRQREKGAR